MGDVVPFRKRPYGVRGSCAHCGGKVEIQNKDFWPEQCPHCQHAPLMVQSFAFSTGYSFVASYGSNTGASGQIPPLV